MQVELQEQDVKTEALTVVGQAQGIIICDQQSYDVAADLLTGVIKPALKKLDDFFTPMQSSAYKAWQAVIARRKEVEQPLAFAEAAVKLKLAHFMAEQERLRLQLEAAMRAEQEAADQKAREQSALEAIEHSASEEEADAAVQEILSLPTTAPAPVVAPTYQGAKGVSLRKTWVAEITDLREFCGAIYRKEIPPDMVEVNIAKLSQLAKAQTTMFKVAGARAVEKATVAGRAK